MVAFDPYMVVENSPGKLHLKLSFKDRFLSIIASRIVPFIIIIILLVTLQKEEVSGSIIVLAGLVSLAISTILILNAKTGIELIFEQEALEIVSLRMLGKRRNRIAYSEVRFIHLEIFQEPEVSGAFYYLVMKDGHRKILLKVPETGDINLLIPINNTLSELTKLEVKEEALPQLK